MTEPWWSDDDLLLSAIEDAERAARDVPAEFVNAGKVLFTWRDIDAELAAITYDSSSDEALAASVRSAGTAPARVLIFATAELTIELELGPEALLGQLVPPQAGTAQTHLATGDVASTPIEEGGYFVFRPPPTGAFRLCCRPDAGANAVTGWVAL